MKNCSCKYHNPLEFVCTLKECPEKRIICKSCAWDHKSHDVHVMPINEWEQAVSNDCVTQRLQHVIYSQGLVQTLEHIIEISKTELIAAVTKRCNALIKELQRHKAGAELSRILDAIQLVQKRQYTQATVDQIVKELDILNLQNQMSKMEAAQYSNHRVICRQVVEMTRALEKMISDFGEKSNGQLEGIRTSIQEKLELAMQPPQQQKPKRMSLKELDDEQLNKYIEKVNQPYQAPFYSASRVNTIPSHMFQSHLEYSSQQQAQPVKMKMQPYANVLTSTEKKKSLADFSFLTQREEKYPILPNRALKVDLSKSKVDLYDRIDRPQNQFEDLNRSFHKDDIQKYDFMARHASQSFHQLPKNK